MSNLESIVPPLELCKQIPAGEFRDSVLVWKERIGNSRDARVKIREPEDLSYKVESAEVNYFPAPTLEEMRWELRNLSVTVYENIIVASCKIDPETWVSETVNPGEHDADATLRIWLKQKGIEVER